MCADRELLQGDQQSRCVYGHYGTRRHECNYRRCGRLAGLNTHAYRFRTSEASRPRLSTATNNPLGMRQVGVQEVDIVSIVKPITKYAVTVLDPNDIRYHLEKAIHLARSGRPGPVWIDIPLDVQAVPIPEPEDLQGI